MTLVGPDIFCVVTNLYTNQSSYQVMGAKKISGLVKNFSRTETGETAHKCMIAKFVKRLLSIYRQPFRIIIGLMPGKSKLNTNLTTIGWTEGALFAFSQEDEQIAAKVLRY